LQRQADVSLNQRNSHTARRKVVILRSGQLSPDRMRVVEKRDPIIPGSVRSQRIHNQPVNMLSSGVSQLVDSHHDGANLVIINILALDNNASLPDTIDQTVASIRRSIIDGLIIT